MIDEKIRADLSDISRRLGEVVPAPLKALAGDLEKAFFDVLQSSLTKLDLVTREEFDVQTEVLARTRAKVEALEKVVAELEKTCQ